MQGDLCRAAAHSVHQAAGLVPLAALLAMLLHLAAQVLGAVVNGVEHLGRGLARSERHPLEVQRGLSDLAVGDRGVALLGQLDLENGVLGNLPADPRKALLYVSAKLLGDLLVPSPHLDPHAPSFSRVKASRKSYGGSSGAPSLDPPQVVSSSSRR